MDYLLADEIPSKQLTKTQQILQKLSKNKNFEQDPNDQKIITEKIQQICLAHSTIQFAELLKFLINDSAEILDDKNFNFEFCKQIIISSVIKLIIDEKLPGRIDEAKDSYVEGDYQEENNLFEALNRAVDEATNTNKILIAEALRKSSTK